MAMQSEYHEKAGVHAKKWIKLLGKVYTPQYIAACVKGYIAFNKTERKGEALDYLHEIILAHYEHYKKQYKILEYLITAQRLHVFVYQTINKYYDEKVNIETKDDSIAQIRYLIDLKNFAQSTGADQLADDFYIKEQEVRKHRANKERQYGYSVLFFLWKITCIYGASFKRWMISSFVVIMLFGAVYYPYKMHFNNSMVTAFLREIKPSLKCRHDDSLVSRFTTVLLLLLHLDMAI